MFTQRIKHVALTLILLACVSFAGAACDHCRIGIIKADGTKWVAGSESFFSDPHGCKSLANGMEQLLKNPNASDKPPCCNKAILHFAKAAAACGDPNFIGVIVMCADHREADGKPFQKEIRK